jgi:adenosylcobinamide-GDP ribazoletransferase
VGLSGARDIADALRFFTRLRVGGPGAAATLDIDRIAWAAPVAGVAVGLIGALVLGVTALLGLPLLLRAAFATAALVAATGALHEDGLADVADGFGGGATRARKLEIMRDSRIGSYGVLALVIVVGLRILCVAELHDSFTAALTLIAAAAGSRAVLPLVLFYLPPAREDGLGHAAGRPPKRMTIDAAAIGGAVLLIGLGPIGGVLAAGGVAAAAYGIGNMARRRIGGQTGDVLGAIQQAAEMVILLAAVATQP